MLPINAEKLIALRKAGQKPARLVAVNIGNYGNWKGEITIPNAMPADRIDLRCLIDLDVMIISEHWTDREAAIYKRIQEYAREILVSVVDFGEDIGWWWVKRWGNDDGRIDFDKRHYFTEWESARAASPTARNQAAYEQIRMSEAMAYAQLTGTV